MSWKHKYLDRHVQAYTTDLVELNSNWLNSLLSLFSFSEINWYEYKLLDFLYNRNVCAFICDQSETNRVNVLTEIANLLSKCHSTTNTIIF